MVKSSESARRAIDEHLASRDHQPPTDGRRRLMKAVLSVALERGNAGLSMRAIAKEVNMQPASIYSHFQGGKDELVAETIQSAYTDFLTAVVGSVNSGLPSDEQFARIAVGHIDFQMASGWTDLWEALVDADRTTAYLTDDTRRNVETMRGLYRDLMIGLVSEFGSGANPETTGLLVIELLNRVTPDGPLIRHLGNEAELRSIVLGACISVARSSPAAVPVDLVVVTHSALV